VPISAPVVGASTSISPSDIYLMLADAFRFIKVYWERTVSEKEIARPVHFWATLQLLRREAAPQLTSIIESAFIAAALRLRVSIARSTLPYNLPPHGAPEQSAALMSASMLYGFSGSCLRGYTVRLESLCSWSSLRVGAAETQELNAKTATGKK
jgi:hypothetical protein